MIIMYYSFDSWETCLYHHGIKGQKWGQRRYQNEDGSYTEEGKVRYAYKPNSYAIKKGYQNPDGSYTDAGVAKYSRSKGAIKRTYNTLEQDYANFAAEKKWNEYKAHKNLQKGRLDKAKASTARAEDAAKKMSTIESNQWKILAAAAKQNYQVVLQDQRRLGKAHSTSLARTFVSGAVGSLLVSSITKGKDLELVTGKKIKLYK